MADTQKQGVDVNAIVNLVSVLLPIIAQFGVPLAEKALAAIKEDPSAPVDALADTIKKRLEEASTIDNEILNEQQ